MEKLIEIVQFFILGVLQGITEPLPISSSGHLVIVQHFFQLPNLTYFLEVYLHVASLLAIVVFYRVKIKSLVVGVYKFVIKKDQTYKTDWHYFLLLLLATVPAAFFGLLFLTFFESFLNLLAVGLSLLVTGSILLLVHRSSVENKKETINIKDALSIGFFQVFALLPGISRSGATMTGGLLRGVKFEKVLEFSFLLYIPVTIGSSLLMIPEINANLGYTPVPLAIAFIASTVMTYLALKWFILLVKKGNLKYFSVYCYIVGSLSILLALFL